MKRRVEINFILQIALQFKEILALPCLAETISIRIQYTAIYSGC